MSSAIEQFVSNVNFSTFNKASDLKKRIYFTLFALFVYRFGTYIPLPGIHPQIIADFARQHAGGMLGILDMFSGGSISRMTIFSLNIMPYISASIIMQLMTSVSSQMEALKKEGESGRRKINQYTRYLTVFMAAIQAYWIAVGLEKIQGGAAVMISGMLFRVITTVTLTGGTVFVMWLGEQITARGIGNGISLIIFAGIVANLPQAVFNTLSLGQQGEISTLIIISILVMVAAVISYIVFMEKAQRKIVVQYPKRQLEPNRPAVSQSSHLPLKLNSSGVIPPIFASALLLFPATINSFYQAEPGSVLGAISHYLSHGQPIYIMLFICMIVFFSFFYTSIVFNPTETADNLKKMGAFIPGVRPGKNTADYIDYILTRLTVIGALYLASVCVIPELILSQVQLPFYLGGTSLLIVVSVTIDTLTQVQSHLVSHQYEGVIKRARLKGKI